MQEHLMVFHVNTSLLCSSTLWLSVWLSCGFTHTYTGPHPTAPPVLHFFLAIGPTVLPNLNTVMFLWIACLKGESSTWRILIRWGDTRTSFSSSLLLAPRVEWTGVLFSRWTCFALGNLASSASLARFAMSAYQRNEVCMWCVRFHLALGWVMQSQN